MKKKIITFTMAGALLLSAAGSFAGSRVPFIKLERSGEQGLHLYMDSLSDLAELTIYDTDKVVLFRDKTDQLNDFKRKFDLSKLPDGSYIFEVELGNQIKQYSFSILNNEVSIAENCKAIYKPTVISKENNLDISYLNLNGEEVSLSIYDQSGKNLASDKIENKQSVVKRYDTSLLPSGNYQVVIKTADRVFVHTVTI
ncbi:T9SS type A sorting domain-containing protein [Fulvivirga sedimenti]|uniref:T9SS type A sorting domain-containing protein n=1 Tax=Fulvivirga sedimenti TaxID=2879465 RepID=A0A9X1HX51_9BACT|nr:T9SS type A sorting domain-containing protein [Fulvivirga sedimenti]MCA6078387.1 T9SS type A sorting domain-containing protein [Fulvivirga sedimenti]